MKRWLESNTTKSLLIGLGLQITPVLITQVRARHLDGWAILEEGLVFLVLLLGNMARADVVAPAGFGLLNLWNKNEAPKP